MPATGLPAVAKGITPASVGHLLGSSKAHPLRSACTAWAHVVAGHADLRDRQNLVLDAVGKPDHRGTDPINDRERYWRQGVGPSQWLRVVVDFSTDPAQIVTAFAERRDPPGWKP